MSSLAVLIPVCCGLLMAAQSPTNAALSRKLNGLGATVLTFGVGTVLQIIVVLIFGTGNLAAITQVPFWQLIGGAYGGYIVLCMTLATPKLGVVLTGALMMFGQVSMGMAIDAFGWFETTPIPFSPLRLIGCLFVCAGILVMYFDARGANTKNLAGQGDAGKSGMKLVLYAILALSAGFASAFQSPTNATLAKTVGNFEATLVSCTVAFIIFSIAFLIKQRGKLIPLTGIPAWQYLPGLYAILGILGNVISTPIIGVGLVMAGIMFGQIGGGMVVDTLGWFQSRKIKVSKGRVIALICIGIGIICTVIGKTMI
jgi:transporter family-2 protein